MRMPILAKAGALLGVVLALALVLVEIQGLVDERGQRGREAVAGVEQSHAAAQVVLGPLLRRDCTEEWPTTVERAGKPVREVASRDFTLTAVPLRETVDGRAATEALHRGLFKVNTYAGHFDVAAAFDRAALRPAAEHDGGR